MACIEEQIGSSGEADSREEERRFLAYSFQRGREPNPGADWLWEGRPRYLQIKSVSVRELVSVYMVLNIRNFMLFIFILNGIYVYGHVSIREGRGVSVGARGPHKVNCWLCCHYFCCRVRKPLGGVCKAVTHVKVDHLADCRHSELSFWAGR